MSFKGIKWWCCVSKWKNTFHCLLLASKTQPDPWVDTVARSKWLRSKCQAGRLCLFFYFPSSARLPSSVHNFLNFESLDVKTLRGCVGSAAAAIDLRSAHTAASRRRPTQKQMMQNTASLLHSQEIRPTHPRRVSSPFTCCLYIYTQHVFVCLFLV